MSDPKKFVTVADLIKALSALDPSAVVLIHVDDGEYNWHDHEFKVLFNDNFEYCGYKGPAAIIDHDVWDMYPDIMRWTK